MIRQGVRICRYAVRIIPKCCPDVTGNSVRMLPKYAQNDGQLVIRGTAYENKLIESLFIYLSALEELNIELPIFIFLTLVGIRGYFMFVGEKRFNVQGNSGIDRDILLLPEVIIENYDTAPEDILKPCFDAMWNACGFPKSPNYDDAGKRIEK